MSMSTTKDQAFILATITQTFILFKCLMSSEDWSIDKHNECCELIFTVSNLKSELAAIVGTMEAHELPIISLL